MPASKPQNIDDYIGGFPAGVQQQLQQVRDVIRKTAPEAEETISYDMPTFNLNGNYLVYFAGWKKHIALYPVNSAMIEKLGADPAEFKSTKGSVHFPLNKPMPLELIEKIVQLQLEERAGKAE